MLWAPKSRRTAVALTLVVCLVGSMAAMVGTAGAESVDDKRAEAKRIADRLDELRGEQMELGAQYERANYELHLAEQRVADAQALADETAAEVDRANEDLRRFAVDAYVTGDEGPATQAIMSEDVSTGVVKRSYLETTNGNRDDLIDALRAARRDAEEETARLEEARAEADTHHQQIEQARASAADATSQQDALNSRVQGELASLVAAETAARAQQQASAAASSASSAPAGNRAPATSRPNPAPAPAPSPSPSPPPAGGSKASGAISAAVSKVGSGYVWGAAGPSTFDCSGLVLWAYAQVGVSLPHYSGAQYSMTTRISASQLQPGDLVFWGPGGSEHVAIYMGGNQLVHAFSSNRAVGITALNGWWKTPSGYGRLNY
jgi:cell wall-associated NlpC family hydrolase